MDIKELVEKKDELIALRKAEIKTVKGGLSSIVNQSSISKGLYKNNDTDLERTIVGNTYLWMDSHSDVHAKGVFTKSIKERKSNIFHLHDHEFKITSKVGEPIDIYEKEITWKELGVNKEGSTQALFMDTKILKEYNNQIYNEYKSNRINQHSVGMQYVKMDLAVNDPQYIDEYETWKEAIDNVGNKEKAIEQGYFWYVREAKLIEISAVLLGSNELTPTLENKEAVDDTSIEPSNDTQNEQLKEFLNKIKI